MIICVSYTVKLQVIYSIIIIDKLFKVICFKYNNLIKNQLILTWKIQLLSYIFKYNPKSAKSQVIQTHF